MVTNPVEVLLTISEPTRLRILNCLAVAPLCVSDLQAILDLPQPKVSRHLAVLRQLELVRDTPVGPYVLYRLRRHPGATGRLVDEVLTAVVADEDCRRERRDAQRYSRSHPRQRILLAEA
jgi:ArsR family transcriptional regulator